MATRSPLWQYFLLVSSCLFCQWWPKELWTDFEKLQSSVGMSLWALVDLQLSCVVELYSTRIEAEAALRQVLIDEPDWANLLALREFKSIGLRYEGGSSAARGAALLKSAPEPLSCRAGPTPTVVLEVGEVWPVRRSSHARDNKKKRATAQDRSHTVALVV